MMDQLLDVLAQVTAGERIALVLLATMALLAMSHPQPKLAAGEWHALLMRARPLYRRACRLFACSTLFFSPFHAAWLLGTPSPPLFVRLGDVVATGLACAAIVVLLAASGVERGLSPERVHRGTWVNIGVLVLLVVIACLIP